MVALIDFRSFKKIVTTRNSSKSMADEDSLNSLIPASSSEVEHKRYTSDSHVVNLELSYFIYVLAISFFLIFIVLSFRNSQYSQTSSIQDVNSTFLNLEPILVD